MAASSTVYYVYYTAASIVNVALPGDLLSIMDKLTPRQLYSLKRRLKIA